MILKFTDNLEFSCKQQPVSEQRMLFFSSSLLLLPLPSLANRIPFEFFVIVRGWLHVLAGSCK